MNSWNCSSFTRLDFDYLLAMTLFFFCFGLLILQFAMEFICICSKYMKEKNHRNYNDIRQWQRWLLCSSIYLSLRLSSYYNIYFKVKKKKWRIHLTCFKLRPIFIFIEQFGSWEKNFNFKIHFIFNHLVLFSSSKFTVKAKQKTFQKIDKNKFHKLIKDSQKPVNA